MGGDRVVHGGGGHSTMRGSKVYEVHTEDGHPFLVGFAGSARVAQAILRLDPPPRAEQLVEDWLTVWCDTVHARCYDLGLVKTTTDEGDCYLAGYTSQVIAIDGRVFLVAEELYWTEPVNGWAAMGSGALVFAGAYEVLRTTHDHPIEAARHAWPVAQRHHTIGDLVDELTLPSTTHPG
jgi:hypothetical protein